MTRSFAPSSSPRPAVRVPPEERRAREQEQAMAEQFAALETRADDDPWLANNPMRRLGYREYGGLEAVDFVPNTRGGSWTESGVQRPRSLSQEEIASLIQMQPDRVRDFEEGRTPFLVPPKTVIIGADYNSAPVRVHEFGHAGHDIIRAISAYDPEMAARFAEADVPRPSSASSRFEEGVVELSDSPDDSWINTRGERATMAHTIEEADTSNRSYRGQLERYNEIMQEIAAEELVRRGEPPRAVMRTPEPGSMFYREPERRRGLLGILDRIMGN